MPIKNGQSLTLKTGFMSNWRKSQKQREKEQAEAALKLVKKQEKENLSNYQYEKVPILNGYKLRRIR